jgi:hypothetical protein
MFTSADLPSASAKEPDRPPRKPPFTALLLGDGSVGVDIQTRAAFEALWSGELATEGLFVATDAPPAFGERLDVRIKTPSGVLKIAGHVVHVIDATTAEQLSMTAGVGLQVEIDERARASAHAYLEGSAFDVAHTATGNIDLDDLLASAKRLIGSVERGDFYRAIDLGPSALQAEVDARLLELERRLATGAADLPPPRAARMQPARNSLLRVKEVLGNVRRRLRYDFKRGKIDAERRLQAAADRAGPDATTLRSVWRCCHPVATERAQRLLGSAFEKRRAREFDAALALGREALQLDPFWLELRRTVETWESLYQAC